MGKKPNMNSRSHSNKVKKEEIENKNILSSSDNEDNDEPNSEFDRDEASNGENIDNIIHSILDGDHLFKQCKTQSNPVPAAENKICK